MGKASSSKKVARAARAGGRRSAGSRQRDLLFPSVIGIIVLLGVALIAFAANDRKTEATIAPAVNKDHWHAAFGIYICGKFQPAPPQFESPIGIHTHGDGVGKNATLGNFLKGTDPRISLSDDELKIGKKSWKVGDQKCNGKDAELILAQWKDVQNTKEKPTLIRRDFNSTRFRENGEGYTIAFVKEGTTDIPKPESAATLAQLGAVDSGGAATSLPAGQQPSTTAGGQSPGTTAPATATTKPGG
jgi:hypothetical protein